MIDVAVLALNGVFDTSLALTLDVLNTAGRCRAALTETGTAQVSRSAVEVCSVGGKPVQTGRGWSVTSTRAIEAIESARFAVIPGLGATDVPGVIALMERADVQRTIQRVQDLHRGGTQIAASCSATFVLAEAGLLDDQPATTTWWLADAFRARYPSVLLDVDRVLSHGNRTLCAGAAVAHADLMIDIVRQLYGEQVALMTGKVLLIDRRSAQTPYVMSSLIAQRHPVVHAAEAWVRARISQPITVTQMAAGLGTSKRTLTRKLQAAIGLSPLHFIQKLRVEHALHLVAHTALSTEAIAEQVGYADASSLRRLIKTHSGQSVREIRA